MEGLAGQLFLQRSRCGKIGAKWPLFWGIFLKLWRSAEGHWRDNSPVRGCF